MFDFIERLRQKSDSSKKKIAFLVSFSISGFIFVVWLTVVLPDFSFSQKQKQAAAVGDAGLFYSFYSNLTEGWNGVQDQFKDLKDTVSSISTSTHYTVNDESADTSIVQENATTSEDGSINL